MTVNAGEASGELGVLDGNSSISVFKIGQSGELELIDQNTELDGIQNIDSGGIRAVSIGIYQTELTTWVAVANQHSNEVCYILPEEGQSFGECLDQYGNKVSALLNSSDTSGRNLQLFTFSEGKLSYKN